MYLGGDQLRATGNVITDPSPDGLVDSVDGNAFLVSVEWDGKNYDFPADGRLEITTPEGTLYIDHNGSYTFLASEDVKADLVADFTYYLRDGNGEVVHADLHVRSQDHIINGTDAAESLSGKTDGDLIQAGGGNDLVQGSNGAEVIYGSGGDDTVHGGGGNDLIHGGNGNDSLTGDAGNDTIFGGAGNDIIYGGEGNDVIYGGSGVNFLNGDSGADIFAWDKFSIGGRDIIADFNRAEGDKLRFDDLLSRNLDEFMLNESKTGIVFSIDMSPDASLASLDKVVEVRFVESDATFSQLVADYDATGNTSLLSLYINGLIS